MVVTGNRGQVGLTREPRRGQDNVEAVVVTPYLCAQIGQEACAQRREQVAPGEPVAYPVRFDIRSDHVVGSEGDDGHCRPGRRADHLDAGIRWREPSAGRVLQEGGEPGGGHGEGRRRQLTSTMNVNWVVRPVGPSGRAERPGG